MPEPATQPAPARPAGAGDHPDRPFAQPPGPRQLDMEAETLGPGQISPTLEYATTPGDSLKRRAVRSTAWQMGAYGVQNLTRFGSNIILTRLVPPHLLGLSAVVSVVYVGLEMFSDLGIGPSIIQNRKGESEKFLRTAFTLQVVRGLVLFLIGCAIAYPVSLYTKHSIHLYLVPVAALVAVFEGLRSTAWFRLQRHLRMRGISILQASHTVLGATGMIIWAWFVPTVWALVVPMVVVAALQAGVTHFLLRDRRDHLGWDPASARDLFNFGGWVFVSSALTFLANSADRLLFAGMISMEMLGIYHIAFVLATMPTHAILRLGSSVVFPAFANVRDDPGRFQAIFHRVRGPLILCGGFAAAGLIGAGRPLVDVIYPAAFADAGWILQILTVAAWLQVLQTSNDAALLATGRPKWVAIGHFCKFLALVSGILLGWNLPGYMGWPIAPFAGAVTGVAAAELVRYFISSHMMHRLGLHVIRRDILLTLWVAGSATLGLVVSGLLENRLLELMGSGVVITLCWLPALAPVLRWWRQREIG